MRGCFALAAIVAVGLAAPAMAASDISWGKPGVSLGDYRADAIACARQAVATDVSHTEAARILARASDRIQYALTPWDVANDVAAARPERQFQEVSDIQHKVLADCLTEHGYRRFQLTKAQRKHLAKLPVGSYERRIYLHDLGSDPKVLAAQAVGDDQD